MTKATKYIKHYTHIYDIVDFMYDSAVEEVASTGETGMFDTLIAIQSLDRNQLGFQSDVEALLDFDFCVLPLIGQGEGSWGKAKELYEDEDNDAAWEAFLVVLYNAIWVELQHGVYKRLEADRDEAFAEYERACAEYDDYVDMVAYRSRDW